MKKLVSLVFVSLFMIGFCTSVYADRTVGPIQSRSVDWCKGSQQYVSGEVTDNAMKVTQIAKKVQQKLGAY